MKPTHKAYVNNMPPIEFDPDGDAYKIGGIIKDSHAISLTTVMSKEEFEEYLKITNNEAKIQQLWKV